MGTAEVTARHDGNEMIYVNIQTVLPGRAVEPGRRHLGADGADARPPAKRGARDRGRGCIPRPLAGRPAPGASAALVEATPA